MMSKEQFDKLMQSLRSMEDKLDILIILHKAVAPKPKVGKEEKKILKLCDRKHTIDDIAKMTGRKHTNVRATLSNLRKKAVIKSVEIKDRLVYERI